jgi:hypothetical protein
MKKIALLLWLVTFLGSPASVTAAASWVALPGIEVLSKKDKEKEKGAKNDQKEERKGVGPPAAAPASKPCCAKPSRQAALAGKSSAPVKKQ